MHWKGTCYDIAAFQPSIGLARHRPWAGSPPFDMTRFHSLLILLLCGLTSCANYEDKRIRQLLNEKGFGTRAQGKASLENYVSGGDGVVFLVDPSVLVMPGAERLVLLTQLQKVGIDGTILLPYVGPVMVLGLTERELKRLVESQLAAFFNVDIQVTPRILDRGKHFFAFGEVLQKGRVPYFKADLNLLEAVTYVRPTSLANMGRVRLIKPDADNPFVVTVNIRDMIMTGNTRYNFPIDENDFLYLPPTWLGGLSRFIEKLLQPLNVAVQSMFGLARIQYSYDILQGDANMRGGSFFRY